MRRNGNDVTWFKVLFTAWFLLEVIWFLWEVLTQ